MSKKESGELRKEKEQQKREEIHERRSQQLVDARKELEALLADARAFQSIVERRDALSDHSKGFYEVVEKLAKGKSLIAVTDLLVEEANNIIRDAKEIITNDVHLNRIKEFVPAGENPVYPDVVVTIRSVRDSLERYRKHLEVRRALVNESLRRANTVIGALEYFLDDEVAEEDKEVPTRGAVQKYTNGTVSDSCFTQFSDSEDPDDVYFDFDRLDEQTISEYLSVTKSDGADAPRARDNRSQSEDTKKDREE
jgi:hypothetical protein